MQGDETGNKRAPGSRWTRALITLLITGFMGVFIWYHLPHSAYPSDLSQIGQGHPVLVLTYDKNYASGEHAMELMNTIRADYAGRVVFLVAVMGTTDGSAFAQRYQAQDGTVLLFAGDGALVKTLNQPKTVDQLRNALHDAFTL
jgi:hypothetical protein